jgi:hypothetical protein
VDKTNDASNSTETSYNMASLSPTGTGELYFGLAVVGGAATAGSSSGFTYHVDDNANLVAYDPNVSASVDPAGSQSGGTGVDSAAVLVIASGSCGGTTTTTGATTTTTHPTTTTTAGTTTTTTTTSCSSSITAVGSLAEVFDANTLSVSPVTTGDIEVLAVQAQPESSAVVASVSGGGVSTWSKAIAYSGSATTSDLEIWWDKVTSTGSSTITVTWSGSTPTYRELDAQEFSAGSGITWSVDKTGDASNSTETSYNMASLSPTGTGELYFGLAVVGGAATAGSSSGFTYHVDDNANLVAYDPNVSASVDPAGSQSGGTGVDSAAALVIASGSCGGTTTTTAGTTTTTHATTTTTSGSGAGGTTTYMVNLTGGVLLEVTGSTET